MAKMFSFKCRHKQESLMKHGANRKCETGSRQGHAFTPLTSDKVSFSPQIFVSHGSDFLRLVFLFTHL